MRFFHTVSLICLIICLCACSGARQARSLPLAQQNTQILLKEASEKQLRLYYSGCSGFYLETENEALLHDPFLSNITLTKQFSTSRSDTAKIEEYLHTVFPPGQKEKASLKAILNGHCHYDHLLDIPYLFYHRLFDYGQPYLYGSDEMKRIMQAWDSVRFAERESYIQSVESFASDHDSLRGWLKIPHSQIRILPILTEHAPHYYGNILFFGGTANLESNHILKSGSAWKEGQTMAYLIDFLDAEGNKTLRIYIQSAGANPPLGLPPTEIDNVDIVILCAASFQYVKMHPESLIQRLKPRLVIVSHWENFFKPLEKLEQTPMVVPLTNMKKFVKRLKVAVRDSISGDTIPWIIPNPGSWIEVGY